MHRIRSIYLAAIMLALAAVAIPTQATAQTPTRPTRPSDTYEQRMKVCDMNNFSCDSGCDKLIDIGTAVSDCKKQCDARYARCQKWAKTVAMIVLPPGGGGISQLKSTCARVGGEFDDGGGLLAMCTKKNCDGMGGECFVVCPSQAMCTAHTPTALTGNQTLLSILQNGDRVFRQVDRARPESSGESRDSGSSSPDSPPVILQ